MNLQIKILFLSKKKQINSDQFNKGIQDVDKKIYSMFVDDSLFFNSFENIKHTMAASIESLYIVLRYPNVEIRQSPLSLDKCHQSICSYKIIPLGKFVNIRTLGDGITEDKRFKMGTELSNLPHKKRKRFALFDDVTLYRTC